MLNSVKVLKIDSKNANDAVKFSKITDLFGDVGCLCDRICDLSAILDIFAIGIVILDKGGEIGVINLYAAELLEEKDGLFLDHRGLKATSTQATKKLKLAIEVADNRVGGTRSALSIPRPSGFRPLSLLVSPIGTDSVVIHITDPERVTPIDSGLIAELFSLTPAESTIAALVTQGKRISEIAETLNISIHTARCHLKHVFSKTGTERQAELANQIGSLLGKLNFGEEDNVEYQTARSHGGATMPIRRAN